MDLSIEDLTKRQREIFDFISRYLSSTATRRRSARSARPWASIPRPLCTPTFQARDPRGAEARPHQAAGDRGAGRKGQACGAARGSCLWSDRSPPVSLSSPRRTSRSTSRSPT